MSIRKTMYVKENSFRNLTIHSMMLQKSMYFMSKFVMSQRVFPWQQIHAIRNLHLVLRKQLRNLSKAMMDFFHLKK